ncbi:hypothetical protein BDV19DRAFT_354498 [Aspergillus venezuelensis]
MWPFGSSFRMFLPLWACEPSGEPTHGRGSGCRNPRHPSVSRNLDHISSCFGYVLRIVVPKRQQSADSYDSRHSRCRPKAASGDTKVFEITRVGGAGDF